MSLEAAIAPPGVSTSPPRGRRTTVRRAPSAGARYRSSKRSVDEGYLATVYRWDERRLRREFARLRWGSHTFMPCPHCGTIDEHTWSEGRDDWRCANTACRKYFDVTTNTLLEGTQRDLKAVYVETFLWSCGSSGIPALTLREMVGTVSYNSTFSLISRMREGLVRWQNTGLIAGVVEIDGAHASGKDSAGRRGKPLAQQRPKTPEEEAAKGLPVVGSGVEVLVEGQASGREAPSGGFGGERCEHLNEVLHYWHALRNRATWSVAKRTPKLPTGND